MTKKELLQVVGEMAADLAEMDKLREDEMNCELKAKQKRVNALEAHIHMLRWMLFASWETSDFLRKEIAGETPHTYPDGSIHSLRNAVRNELRDESLALVPIRMPTPENED